MSNVVLAQKHNSTQMDKLKLSAAGDLKVHIQDGLIGAADNDLSDQATKLQVFPYLEKPDGSLTVAKCDADGNLKAELTSSVDVTIGDVDMIVNTNGDGSGTKKHALCDSSGRLEVAMTGHDGAQTNHVHVDSNGIMKTQVVNAPSIIPHATINSAQTDNTTNAFAVGLQGRTTIGSASTATHLLCDAAGHLQVDIPATSAVKLEDLSSTIDADHVNNSRSLPATMKGRSSIGDHTTGTYLLCDSDGHLQVDVVSGGGGGDASAANQNTANTHLSEIEGAVETIEACVSSDKLAISSAQLPASLGQKANANCLATCRSSTVGAYDLSGRSTIGTASSSTKLLCDTDGFLRVSAESRVEGATTRLNNIILENSLGTGSHASATIDLGVAHKMNVVKFYINSATGGFNLHVRVSADGTNYVYASGVTFQTIAISGGGSVHTADPRVVNPPRYVQIYNNDTASTFTISEMIVIRSSTQ